MLKHVWHHGFKILNEVFVGSCSTQDDFLVLNPIFSCTECASLKPNISRSKYLVWIFFEIAVHLLWTFHVLVSLKYIWNQEDQVWVQPNSCGLNKPGPQANVQMPLEENARACLDFKIIWWRVRILKNPQFTVWRVRIHKTSHVRMSLLACRLLKMLISMILKMLHCAWALGEPTRILGAMSRLSTWSRGIFGAPDKL